MKFVLKFLSFFVLMALISYTSSAQKRKTTKAKTPVKRSSTRRTTKNRTTANIKGGTASADSAVVASSAAQDSLPIKKVLKSLRRDAAVDDDAIRDRTPLAYENLRADDAVYRHKIWREIDAREKINLPFRYAADQDNGNQRFLSILLTAIQDSAVTVFDAIDDRFTTPMTRAQVAEILLGPEIEIKQFNEKGDEIAPIKKRNELNPDSVYKRSEERRVGKEC